MTHPLIARLTTEIGWPRLSQITEVEAFVNKDGAHCLFIPGDPVKNLETTDAAVILPEIVQSFQGKFDCAVIDESIDYQVRENAGIFKTPLLVFFRDGVQVGAIPKVRDWDDYLARVAHILTLIPEGAD